MLYPRVPCHSPRRPVLSAGQPDVTKMFNYPIAPQRRKKWGGESEGKHTHSFARLDIVLLIEVLEFSMQSSIKSWGSSRSGPQSLTHDSAISLDLGKLCRRGVAERERERALSIFLSSLPNSLSKSLILIKCDLLGSSLR